MFKTFILVAFIGIAFVRHASSTDTYNEKELTGKVAIVTGAARGIGLAITDQFLQEGVRFIIMVDKDNELGLQASKDFNTKYGNNRTTFINGHTVKNFDEIKSEISKFGHVDILVNDAGILNEDDAESVYETNVLGTTKWANRYYNIMRKDRGGKCGTIINIASIAGYLVTPFMPIYTASKYALIGFSKTMGHEYNYERSCVRVVAVCPGLTNSKMTEQQMVTDDQLEIWAKFKNASSWQTTSDMGKGVLAIFKTAESGTSWDVIGGADPVESPASQDITAAYLESL